VQSATPAAAASTALDRDDETTPHDSRASTPPPLSPLPLLPPPWWWIVDGADQYLVRLQPPVTGAHRAALLRALEGPPPSSRSP